MHIKTVNAVTWESYLEVALDDLSRLVTPGGRRQSFPPRLTMYIWTCPPIWPWTGCVRSLVLFPLDLTSDVRAIPIHS